MPNQYFKFKKFTVYHDKCAMKVGTDGVLLGAWTNPENAKTALDIGSGTGLIALMIAQRSKNIQIDAIDISEDATEQAKENCLRSPFSDQINCIHSSLNDFAKLYNKRYDLIVSNPPFFVQSLKSPDRQRSLARHNDSLTLESLIYTGSELLDATGRLSLILPSEQKNTIVRLAEEHNLSVSRITNVYPTPGSLPKRILTELSKTPIPFSEDNLIIENERHVYSNDFSRLAKDFYLKL